MKPTKDFKISKQTKRMMATFKDPVERHAWKNMMIQAELAEKQAKNEKFKYTKGEEA
jgi:hypothetical protein